MVVVVLWMSGAGSGSQLSTEDLTLTCLAPLPLELQLLFAVCNLYFPPGIVHLCFTRSRSLGWPLNMFESELTESPIYPVLKVQ